MAKTNKNIVSKKNKASILALLPIFVFAASYIATCVVFELVPDLKSMFGSAPIIPSFIVGLIVAIIQYPKTPLQEKFKIIGHGVGNKAIISMIFIFILAGVFAGTVGVSCAESVAYFLLSIIPPQFCVGVLFVVSCLVALAMGTSCGAITVITPIAILTASIADQNYAICVASVVGGSMFGDNLSMISDTTIASTTGQGCNMRDKFFTNFKMVVPAALITLVIILLLTFNAGNGQEISNQYNMIEFIPYVLVLVLGICGLNVFIVLGVGIVSGIIVLVIEGVAGPLDILSNMANGAAGMYELIIVTIIVASMAALVKHNGGFDCVLSLVEHFCHSKKSALFGTGLIVGIIDLITANNTVAIVVANPIAAEIRKEYKIRRRVVASVLDIFSCIFQGLLPYGAQLLIVVQFCSSAGVNLGATDIIPFCIYQYVLLIVMIVGIFSGIGYRHKGVDDKNYNDKDTYKDTDNVSK